jgi:hypothetical protein
MANINKVGPGDLITAQLMNSIIDAIQALQAQVQALQAGTSESGQKPVILATIPAGSIAAGEPIQVIGQNFSPGNDIVTFAGFTIDALSGSSNSTTIAFTVPDLTFNGASKDVLISVRNSYGVATWPITLLPAKIVPHGQIAFSSDPSVPVPAAITKGSTFTFGFLANSMTNIPETYTFSVNLSNVSGSTSLATWQSSIKLTGANNAPLPSTPLQPYTNLKLTLSVTVPVNAGDNDTVTVTIRGKSQSNDAEVSRSSQPIVIKVGAASAVSDPGIVFYNDTLTAAGLNPAFRDQATDVVCFPYKKPGVDAVAGRIKLRANFTEAGKATYKLEGPSTADWELVAWGPQGTTASTQSGQDKAAGNDETFDVILRLKREAPADASAHPEAATVKITATRTVSGQPRDSFTVINIRGYVKT